MNLPPGVVAVTPCQLLLICVALVVALMLFTDNEG